MEKKSHFGRILLLALITVIAFVAYKRTETTPSTLVSVEQSVSQDALVSKKEVEQMLREYILKNPDVIIESIEKMHKRKIEEMNVKTEQILKAKKDELENDIAAPKLGKGSVNIVMIYDYACSYCRKASSVIDELLGDKANIKVIYRPYPILGDSSEYMTKVAMSVYKLFPDKFQLVHNAMMNQKITSREDVIKILESNNIPVLEIESEFESIDIKNSLSKLSEIARQLKIQGVPVFIIDSKLHAGLVDIEKMREIIKSLSPDTDMATAVIEEPETPVSAIKKDVSKEEKSQETPKSKASPKEPTESPD